MQVYEPITCVHRANAGNLIFLINMYGKLYERECYSCYIGTSAAFKVLRIAFCVAFPLLVKIANKRSRNVPSIVETFKDLVHVQLT